jgi:hypothetical protein
MYSARMVHCPRKRIPSAHLVSIALSAIALSTLSSAPASAAIFAKSQLWPQDASGLTTLPVCVEDDSSATQKRGGIYAFFIYDPNPSLAEVVQHVRAAVNASWSSVSSVRFTDWRACSALSDDERGRAMHLYIHPDAANASMIGTDTRGASRGVNFKPWGSESTANICIRYNGWTTHMTYDFSCVEQYAIHEFGHALGFLHEWYNPSTPSACTQKKQSVQSGDWGPPLSGATASCLGGGATCVTVNPASFDARSVMTYDAPCADVHGVRFGDPTLDNWDAVGAWAAYPRVAPATAPSDFLGTGFGLLPGAALRSPNGRYTLTLQTDGNLVLYDASGHATWATGTWGQQVDYAIMQVDGNLVLYGNGAALWASGTSASHARLVVRDDGNVVLYSLVPKWSTGSSVNALVVGDGARGLRAGEWLMGGTSIASGSGEYTLAMQADGNLVVYRPGWLALWASGTQGANGASATLQSDGNFVVYTAGGSAAWSSHTNGATNDALLTIEDDGNLVLADKSVVWATNTH